MTTTDPSRSPSGAFRRAAGAYGRLFAIPGAAAFFLPASIARLGVAMTGLGLIFSLHQATGSYSVAGLATGVFAAAEAVAGPQLARLVDRWGQTVTVPVLVLVHAVALTIAIGSAGSSPAPLLLLLLAAAGAAVPQPGALSAARWTNMVRHPPLLRTAFSLEATVNDVVFLAGPLFVTVAATVATPWAGSALALTFLVIGCLVLCGQRDSSPAPSLGAQTDRRHRATSLLSAHFIGTLGVNVGLGCFFGAVTLLVTDAAAARSLESWTGAVLALSSAASIASGLLYGAWRTPPRPQLVQLAASLALLGAVVVGATWSTLAGLAVMLLIGGTAIAPLVASSSQIVTASVRRSELTQGFTWTNTASAVGIAVSAALTGYLLEQDGLRAASAALIALVAIAVVCAGLTAALRAARPDDPDLT